MEELLPPLLLLPPQREPPELPPLVCGGAGVIEGRGGREEARGTEGIFGACEAEALPTVGTLFRVTVGTSLPVVRIWLLASAAGAPPVLT